MKTKDNAWANEAIEELKRLWAEGLSCSQIAAMMGRGLTRNAIIGKAHRLKLSRRQDSSWKARGVKRKKPRKPFLKKKPERGVHLHVAKPPKIEPEAIEFTAGTWDPLPGSVPVGIEALHDGICRWPLGDPYGPPATLFCGCAAQSGKSYCKEHATRAGYRPSSSPKARDFVTSIRKSAARELRLLELDAA